MAAEETQLGDLSEACLAYTIALTSPRDACRFAAVSPSFRSAADSDDVWQGFIPKLDRRDVLLQQPPAPNREDEARKKDAYLGLCNGGGVLVGGDGGCRMWLERASGAKCYALSAKRLSLPWDDGEYSWRWKTHPLSRFAEVAELADCTCLDIYGRLPAAALTRSTPYAAYLVYGAAESGHRGLSYPDQETTVAAAGGRVVERYSVCLLPDDTDTTRKFRGGAARREEPRRPTRRDDGWWEMEMGRLLPTAANAPAGGEGDEVVASFEVFGWYPKRGLVVEAVEFKPMHHS